MNIVGIIEKKTLGLELNYDELDFFVNGFIDGSIKDYQMSALLMAICLKGMTNEEVINLTDIMIKSGEVIDLSKIQGIKVDKHSTGGVGDKTTLALIPIVASCGVKVAKMSGRSLGHTGGTIDKLESISGFNTEMSLEDFTKQVNKINLALISQMNNICIADKKIYALRDVTGTTESVGLIASSIMSKKIASGADKFVIDVKVGHGAFMKNMEDAEKLSKLMIKIGKHYGKDVVCVLTSMDDVLGYSIGNGLEVKEAIDCLNNKGEKNFTKLVIKLASIMVSLAKNITEVEARKEVTAKIESGAAYKKFIEFVSAQGGDINKIDISNNVISIKSNKSGIIYDIDSLALAKVVKSLGAGRTKKNDKIDYGVGIVLSKKVGDMVLESEELAKVYIGKKDCNISDIIDAFKIDDRLVFPSNIILKVIK